MSMERRDQIRLVEVATLASFAIPFAISTLVLLAWTLQSANIFVSYRFLYDMKFNTALMMLLSSLSIYMSLQQRWGAVYALNAFVFALSGITLLQYVTGKNFGTDELFMIDSFYHPVEHDVAYPGRMAPNTAAAFLVSASAFFLMGLSQSASGGAKQWRMWIVELSGFIVFGLGATGIISRSALSWVFWAGLETMVIQTAICFLSLGIGLILLRWKEMPDDTSRLSVPLTLMLCFAVLLVDMVTPEGIVSGVGYIPLVFCSLMFASPYYAFMLAGIGTVFSVMGYFISHPANMEDWKLMVNRGLTLGILWVVALLLFMRSKTETNLRQSETKIRAVIDNVLDALIMINSRGVIETFNPAAERIFGYDKSEVIGRNINMLMPDPYHTAHDGYISNYHKTAQPKIIGTAGREVTAKRKDGSEFPIDLSVSKFTLKDGMHFTGIVRDISSRKDAERRINNYMRSLERSNQELDDFAYIASHDLKEPLRGVHNHATFLLEDYGGQLPQDAKQRLNRLAHLAQRMEHLVNDLLYFSRLGRAELAVREADLNAVIHEIEQMSDIMIKENNARIVIPKPLPRVVCDKPRITEVFRNLITNGIKYNDKNDKTIEVGYLDSVDTPEGRAEQVFYVKDNGIGIEKEFYNEIFRLFKRLNHSNDNSQDGTGVGLTFVKKIIERHNGKIWLDSVRGEGTTFYFTISNKGMTA